MKITEHVKEKKQHAMDPQNVKMIFFDIDDTLRDKTTGYMPASVHEAVKRLHEKGIAIGIATGRALYGIVPEIRALHADYFVTINGQYVINKTEEILYSNEIASVDIEAFIAWSREHDLVWGMVGAKACAVSAWTPLVADTITPIYGVVPVDPDFYQKYAVYQLWSFSADQVENTIPAALSKHLKVVRWHQHSCDLIPIGASKARGIAVVLDRLGLDQKNILVFGDGLNDIEMFQYAGYAVAMGNAHESLKAHADFETKDLHDDGIMHALTSLRIIE